MKTAHTLQDQLVQAGLTKSGEPFVLVDVRKSAAEQWREEIATVKPLRGKEK